MFNIFTKIYRIKYYLISLLFVGLILFIFSLNNSTKKFIPAFFPIPTPIALPTKTESLQDIVKQQTISDKNFGIWQDAIVKQYSWYQNLPLQTDDYFVYFDINQKLFIGYIYTHTSSSTPLDAQEENIKSTALKDLEAIGVQMKNYSFKWKVTPAP